MEIENVKAFLEENKDSEEVKQLFGDFRKVSVQDVEELTQSDKELRSWLDSQKDRHFSKGLDTWKENNLESFITEKYNERHPVQAPQDIEIDRMKKQLADMEREKQYGELKNKALTFSNENDLPANLIDFFIGDDEESTINNLKQLQEESLVYIQRQVDKRLRDNSYEPPGGSWNNGNVSNSGDFVTMTYKEKVKLKQENPTAYENLVGK